jgi:hypothetical protein
MVFLRIGWRIIRAPGDHDSRQESRLYQVDEMHFLAQREDVFV